MRSAVKEIKYGTELHKKIINAIDRRRRFAENARDDFLTDWKKDEDRFLAYLPERDADAARRVKRENEGEHSYTTIEIPYSYATLMTAATYISSVFLSRDPVYQMQGRHGEPEESRNAVEAIMEYQRMVGEHTVQLFGWILDAGKRGVGFISPHWVEEKETISTIEEVQAMELGLPLIGKTERKRRIHTIDGFKGNRLRAIRPQHVLIDPRKPVSQIQKGEFFGEELYMSWNAIVKGWQDNEYFNLEALRKYKVGQHDSDFGSTENTLPERDGYDSLDPMMDLKNFKVTEWTIELSPRDWGLGNTTSPEKWVFLVAEESVIFHARPQGEFHNKFPVAVLEYEIDPHMLFNRSMVRVLEPMQRTISWLVNSHFYNVRKTLNDMFVYDPSRVVAADVKDGRPGKMMRLRPNAYGTDVRTVIQQLPVQDVTAQHLKDLLTVMDFGQRVVGVNDNLMGNLDPRGRKSATEARIAGSSGAARLKMVAEYMSAEGWSPLLQMMLQSTQQHYDAEMEFRIAGDLVRNLQSKPTLAVTPEDIRGFYDFVPVDGAAPMDKFALANLWRDLIREASSNQMIAMSYNIPDMFGWVAQLAGMKNIQRFKINVIPDEQAAMQAQAGNLIPLGGAGGANSTGANRAGPTDAEGASRPRQVSGMGPAS